MASTASSNSTFLSNYSTFRSFVQPSYAANFEWEQLVYSEWTKFQVLHDRCIAVFDKVETTLLLLGFFGNLLALITLLKGHHTRTPSFVYHKVLIFAYLIYCSNFIAIKCVNLVSTVPSQRRQLVYYNQLAAYYAIILNRVITSVCGYLALYTSLAISVDRFVALVVFKNYNRFNKHFVAYSWIGVSLVLSVCVHSWAPWVENEIQPTSVTFGGGNHANHSILAYRHRHSSSLDKLVNYLMAKDWYNLVVRFMYSVLLTVLTASVIYMFTKQQKKRLTLCNVSKRQLRRERSLFYLMVAVVIMAYIQVIPRESKRVLELVYPPAYVASKIKDTTLPIDSRKGYLLFGLYGFTFTTPVLNLCTTIERCLIFYLYFALNHTFRGEVLRLLHLDHKWHKLCVKLGVVPEQEHPMRQFELASKTTRRISDCPSAAQHRTTKRGSCSNGNCCTTENGRLLPPIAPNRDSSDYTSFKTIYSEFSSVV